MPNSQWYPLNLCASQNIEVILVFSLWNFKIFNERNLEDAVVNQACNGLKLSYFQGEKNGGGGWGGVA